MKKAILTAMALLVILLAGTAVCRAEKILGSCGAEGGNVLWALEDNGSLHIYGEGEMAGYGVWNDYKPLINTVVIYPNVSNVGWGAFSGFTNLTNVIFYSGSVTRIDSYAFEDCTSLAQISIPSTVTAIKSSAFSGCTSLAAVDIPYGVTSIGTYAFEDCVSLTGVTLPASLTTLGGSAFCGCTALTGIAIPEQVTSIEGSTFRGCTGLTSASLPEGLVSIGAYAFYGCTGLKNLNYPSSLRRINMYAFAGCTGMTGAELPAGMTSIGNGAYADDPIRCVLIPSDRVSFGNGIFSGAPTVYCDQGNPAEAWANGNGYPVVWLNGASADAIRSIAVDSVPRLFPGDTILLTADVFPYSDAPAVAWSSSDPAVLSVQDGLLTANGAGTAVISVAAGGAVLSFEAEVVIPLESFSLPEEIRLFEGETFALAVTDPVPADAWVEITWASDDETVAAVDAEGLVEAVSAGTAVITATDSGGACAACTVVVREFTAVLTLPAGLTVIEAEAFTGLSSAEAVRIPASVTAIGDGAFDGSGVVILAPAGSYPIQWAGDHGVRYIEEPPSETQNETGGT